MTIRRLRPSYTDVELREVYARQYDHTRWADHVMRVQESIDFIHATTVPPARRIVADLSCGDAAIARGLQDTRLVILGDYVANDEYAFTGRIEDTIRLVGYADLFILSETMEHVDNPTWLLTQIRQRAGHLFISTPLDERDDGNPEHYWGWDEDGVRELLEITGWKVAERQLFTPPTLERYYTYQMWMCYA